MARCVIIPSIAVSMLPPEGITLAFTKLTWDEFASTISRCERVINFIRHRPTNDLLSALLSVKFETGFEYRINDDVIFMIGLKSRAPTPGADVAVTVDDLLIYLAKPVR